MKISVVTITRNDGALLARTIRSIYAQKLPQGVELEHIIVDGCRHTPNGSYSRRGRGSRQPGYTQKTARLLQRHQPRYRSMHRRRDRAAARN